MRVCFKASRSIAAFGLTDVKGSYVLCSMHKISLLRLNHGVTYLEILLLKYTTFYEICPLPYVSYDIWNSYVIFP